MTHFRSFLAVGAMSLALTALVFAGDTKPANSKSKCCCKSSSTTAAAKCTGCCTKCGTTQATGVAEACETSASTSGCCEECKKSGQKDCCCKSCNNKECCGTCCKDCPACAAACNSKALVRVYSVGDLLAGSKDCCANDMVRVITGVVQTASWECNGGPGAIEYFPGTKSLVIRQTPAIHEQITNLLASLRKSGHSSQPQAIGFRITLPSDIMTAAAHATPTCAYSTSGVGTLTMTAPSCQTGVAAAAWPACPTCCGQSVPTPPLTFEEFMHSRQACPPPPPAPGVVGNVFFANPCGPTPVVPPDVVRMRLGTSLGYAPTPAGPPALIALPAPTCYMPRRNVQILHAEPTPDCRQGGIVCSGGPVPPPPQVVAPPCNASCRMAVDLVCMQKADSRESHLVVTHPCGGQLQCDKFCIWLSGCKPIQVSMLDAPAQHGIVQAAAHSEVPGTVEIRCGDFTAMAQRVEQVDGQHFRLSGNVRICCHDKACPSSMKADTAMLSVANGTLRVDRVESAAPVEVPTCCEESSCHDPLANLIWSSMFGGW